MRSHVSSTLGISMPAVQLVGLHGLLSITRRLHREEKRSGRIAVGKGLGLLHRGVARLSLNGKGHEVAAGLGKRKECGPGVVSTTKGGRTAGAVGHMRRRGGGVKNDHLLCKQQNDDDLAPGQSPKVSPTFRWPLSLPTEQWLARNLGPIP